MARPRKPWFRKSNKTWYVEFHGKQVNLGRNKKEAFKLFHELMAQPEDQEPKRSHSAISLPELVDHFLEWVQPSCSIEVSHVKSLHGFIFGSLFRQEH